MDAGSWRVTMVGTIILINLCSFGTSWVSIQPRQNIWVTLANMTGQNHMCLSMASVQNPA